MSTPAIAIRRVTKRFGSVTAVNDVSLDVPEGSIYGFIGPNGSGKSTTLRMIMNIFLPDDGEILVFDRRRHSSARDEVGYLPEERGLYKRMTVRQVLRYYGELKGRTGAMLDGEIVRWLDRFELRSWADKKVETLSKGMSQKIQFVAAVVFKPRLLILDEPFSGLDPVNADVLRDAVLDLRRQGTTIVFSTHDMTSAESMCDRIFMIFKGEKVLDGSLEDIQARYGQDTIRLRTAAGRGALAGLPGIESVNDLGNYQEVRISGDAQQFLRLVADRTAVFHFELKQPSLHDIFVRIARPTAEELRVPAGATA